MIDNVRKIGKEYRMEKEESEVFAQTNIKKRSNRVVYKEMEYVFGW
jgi:hypothetical protein